MWIFFALRRVGLQVAGDAIVEAHAEGQQQIGLLNRGVDPGLAVHAHHAEVQRMVRGDAAEAEQRHRDRGFGLLGEGDDLLGGARLDDAAAGEDHRPLRLANQLDRALEVGRRRPVIRPIAAELRLGAVPVELARRLLRVLGDVDQHRSRAAGGGDVERLANRRRDVLCARHQVVVLRDRQRHAGDVGLLEGVAADQLAADLSRDADDRRGVEHRRGDAGDHVRRAGARCGDGDADLSGRAGEPVGHVRRALLVADQDVPDRVLGHRVVGRQDGAARIAEDRADALPHQAFPDDLRACFFHIVTR